MARCRPRRRNLRDALQYLRRLSHLLEGELLAVDLALLLRLRAGDDRAALRRDRSRRGCRLRPRRLRPRLLDEAAAANVIGRRRKAQRPWTWRPRRKRGRVLCHARRAAPLSLRAGARCLEVGMLTSPSSSCARLHLRLRLPLRLDRLRGPLRRRSTPRSSCFRNGILFFFLLLFLFFLFLLLLFFFVFSECTSMVGPLIRTWPTGNPLTNTS